VVGTAKQLNRSSSELETPLIVGISPTKASSFHPLDRAGWVTPVVNQPDTYHRTRSNGWIIGILHVTIFRLWVPHPLRIQHRFDPYLPSRGPDMLSC